MPQSLVWPRVHGVVRQTACSHAFAAVVGPTALPAQRACLAVRTRSASTHCLRKCGERARIRERQRTLAARSKGHLGPGKEDAEPAAGRNNRGAREEGDVVERHTCGCDGWEGVLASGELARLLKLSQQPACRRVSPAARRGGARGSGRGLYLSLMTKRSIVHL